MASWAMPFQSHFLCLSLQLFISSQCWGVNNRLRLCFCDVAPWIQRILPHQPPPSLCAQKPEPKLDLKSDKTTRSWLSYWCSIFSSKVSVCNYSAVEIISWVLPAISFFACYPTKQRQKEQLTCFGEYHHRVSLHNTHLCPECAEATTGYDE